MRSLWFRGAGFLTLLLFLLLPPILIGQAWTLRWTLLTLFLFVAALAYRFRLFWVRYPLLALSIGYFGFYEGSCLCETGALESLMVFLGLGRFSALLLPLIRVLLLLVVVFFFGNLFCGWVCQKGGVQEFLYRERWGLKLPVRVVFFLERIRHLVLAGLIVLPLLFHRRFFREVDPFRLLFNLDGPLFLLLILLTFLLLSLFVYRPFCRFFCPLGALLGLVHRFSPGRIRVDHETCRADQACTKECFSQALHTLKAGEPPELNTQNCYLCGQCSSRCPKGCIGRKG